MPAGRIRPLTSFRDLRALCGKCLHSFVPSLENATGSHEALSPPECSSGAPGKPGVGLLGGVPLGAAED